MNELEKIKNDVQLMLNHFELRINQSVNSKLSDNYSARVEDDMRIHKDWMKNTISKGRKMLDEFYGMEKEFYGRIKLLDKRVSALYENITKLEVKTSILLKLLKGVKKV